MPDPFYQLRWQQLQDSRLSQRNTELWICQLQCAIPEIAGNKWLKLKYHIQQIQQHTKAGILTFGGAFSNHLAAVAAAGQHFDFRTQGIVRSHQPDPNNPTLRRCLAMGMQLEFVSGHDYRQRHDPAWLAELQQRYPDFLLVPEGGSSELAVRGVAELALSLTPAGPAHLICSAAASGGTLAGIIAGNQPTPVLGIAVLKDPSLPQQIQRLLAQASPTAVFMPPLWSVWPDITGLGYGKFNRPLLDACLQLTQQGIYVEPIYTGKALLSLLQWIDEGRIAPGSRLAFFHTGGWQALAGLYYRGLLTADELSTLTPVMPASTGNSCASG